MIDEQETSKIELNAIKNITNKFYKIKVIVTKADKGNTLLIP